MKPQKSDTSVTKVAINLEVYVIPVSDVERSKQFYQRLGWRLDADDAPAKNVRIVRVRRRRMESDAVLVFCGFRLNGARIPSMADDVTTDLSTMLSRIAGLRRCGFADESFLFMECQR